MKKIIFSLVVLSLLVQFPLFATETEQEAMSATLTNQSAGVPAGAPGVSMSQPAGMPTPGTGSMGTMGAHMQNQMVLTNDGSVILFMGWRLMKYDANLNLVKDVVIPLPKFPGRNKQPAPTVAEADQSAAAGLQGKVI